MPDGLGSGVETVRGSVRVHDAVPAPSDGLIVEAAGACAAQ
jgi:hypothetical protein